MIHRNKYCDHERLNALLEEFAPVAAHKGIRLETDIDMVVVAPMADDDLIAVFKAALDNAVSACAALPEGREKFIRIKSRSFPRWVVSIQNACGTPVPMDGDAYPVHRGRATDFIISTLERSHMAVCYVEKDGVFKLQFIYNIPSPPSHT